MPAWAESSTAYVPGLQDKVMGLQNDASLPQLAGATAMDGVSILPNFQTQFGQVIRTKSLGFLLNKMEKQHRAPQ